MRYRVLAGCIVIAVSGALPAAQEPSLREPGRGFVPGPRGGGPGGIDVLAVEPIELGEAVLGAPFSAETVTETIQNLADGNRIERRTMSTIARDGHGRIRREQALPAIGPVVPAPEVRIVTISDPAERVLYLLDSARKTATKSRPPGLGPRPDGGRTGPPPQGPPFPAGARPEVTTERLGTREVAGVRTEGTRTTMTIPAGAFGNVRSVDIVTERWYSPELKVVVESRRMDPIGGEVTYRLTNLVRAKPPVELFQVPPDYSVVERPRPAFGPPRGN